MAIQDFGVPADCGKRLLPAVVDQIARDDPERVFVSIPKTLKIEDGFRDVTYAEYARAIDRCAWFLEKSVGKPASVADRKVLFYIGPLDLRYLVIITAAAKVGHVAMFTSLRNSLEAHLSLLQNAGAHTILLPAQVPPIVGQILEARPMEKVPFGEVSDFFNEEPVQHYPFTLKFEEAKDYPFCILHTSGSTGIPKPVRIAYGTLAANDAHQLIPGLGGKETLTTFLSGKRYFLALPLFHAACLTFAIAFNVFAGVIPVLPPSRPITADVANEVFLHGDLYGALMAPSLIIDCFNNDEFCVNMVKHLKFLSYVGGALPAEVGDPVAKRIRLMTVIGSCETALHPLEMLEDPADWSYFSFSPFLGHSFRKHEEDGLEELTIVKDPKHEIFQGVFHTFPEKDVFYTNDLFQQHPTKSDKWAFRARADDIIAFTTAEKLNPITMEGIIAANPLVKSALIGGQGQFQAALLIEPRVYPETKEDEEKLIDNVWPDILKANQSCPAHGKIMRGFVMLTEKDKPLPRAGKDTVQRHGALKLYEQEFKDLYARLKPYITNAQAVAAPTSEVKAATGPFSESEPTFTLTQTQLETIIQQTVKAQLEIATSQIINDLKGKLGIVDKTTASSDAKEVNGVHVDATQTNGVAPTTNGTTHVVSSEPAVPATAASTDDKSAVRKIIYDHLAENIILDKFEDSSNMFEAGLDSVSVPPLLNAVNAYLIKHKPEATLLDTKVVYEDGTSVADMLKLCGL